MIANSIRVGTKKQLLNLQTPLVMGILNVTPDSFYSQSRVETEHEIVARAAQILDEGGSIIDIGGYSTRPVAEEIDEKTEADRLFFALDAIKKHFPEAILSVDTFRAPVAEKVITTFGVDIINDVSGGTLDDRMFETVARYQVPYILMHMRGTPKTMQQMTDYDDPESDLMRFFAERINRLTELGVSDIIIDPGFGFAKTIRQNFRLLRDLSHFQIFGRPILAGLSRKSMLYKSLECTPEQCLAATVAANTMALNGGASVLRVHDVKEAVDTIAVYRMTREA
jgi:dihydropteroate synthase